jgi:Spy/CpxP family protein refolding chaperone
VTRFPLFLLSALVITASNVAAQGAPSAAQGANRAQLEQRFREQAAKLIQQRLALTDKQVGQLQQSNQRFAPQLTQLASQERETRRQLREEMQSASPNQSHVSDLLDASLRFQKQRISIIEAEQKDLASFLTPVQRARYLALQAQFRNRAQELSRQNGGRRGRRPGTGNRP